MLFKYENQFPLLAFTALDISVAFAAPDQAIAYTTL